MHDISVVNGPNLNILHKRSGYGELHWDMIAALLHKKGSENNLNINIFQSNHEGDLIDFLHEFKGHGLIINAGGLSHSSISLRDGLSIVNVPRVEVHLTNIYSREAFRHYSFLSAVVDVVIAGAGADGYLWAIEWLSKAIDSRKKV